MALSLTSNSKNHAVEKPRIFHPLFERPADISHPSPTTQEHVGPLLLLVCGSAPGGAAGVWGRSLCINASLHEGAMFDYIFRAQELGWAVPWDEDQCLGTGSSMWESWVKIGNSEK